MDNLYYQDSLEESRILNEIRGLEERLNFKSSRQLQTLSQSKAQQKLNCLGRYPQMQEQDRAFLQHINNIQYFSEINNQETEEDSLFQHQMHLFARPDHSKASTTSIRQISETSKSSNKQNRNSQIAKEQEYIFRKQKEKDKKSTTPKLIHPKPNLPRKPKQQASQPQPQNGFEKKDSYNKQSTHQGEERQVRLKTQQPYYVNNIDAYLQQIAQHKAPKIKEQGKSKSRIKTEQHSLQCTFKPSILKKSKEMVKSTKNVVQRLSTNNNKNKINKVPYQAKPNAQKPRMQRIEQLSQPRRPKNIEPEQVEELPSFKPQLSKKSLSHMSNCTYDVATRNKLWLQQKEEKINQMRKDEEEERLKNEECTYSPAIKVYRGEQDIQFSKFGKQGMVQYFERLSLLKKKSSSKLRKEAENKDEECSYAEKNMKASRQKSFSKIPNANNVPSGYKSKKQTYEQAVKNLHSKIMKLKI